ncbi:uncharacterized protein [Cardiocondyla obscurior]|uniref:uncharacterized protein n=1 Tax=Cardiocondyla obscurior TaxID=286306 RepID=UPI0039656F27
MADILIIDDKPIFENSIVKIETYTYNPYANTTFGYSDEIRIPIQQQDLYTLPCDSFLHIEGKIKIKKSDDKLTAALGNNCVAFMFDKIRYELNGVEIDSNRNVEITSTLKNYILLTSDNVVMLQNAGWSKTSTTLEKFFNFCLPLSILLGFCEDYKRFVVNARHELILIRARNDNNSIIGNSELEPEIELHKIQWRMSHVILNESTIKHSWAVKAATQLEKPRYVIFALQTDRKNVMSKKSTIFDDCKLTNVKLYLNSEYYPYDDLNLDFDKNRYAILSNIFYEAFCNVAAFLSYRPFVVIDCSRQNESIKSVTVDVRLEFDCKENVPRNNFIYTNHYCFEYAFIMVVPTFVDLQGFNIG